MTRLPHDRLDERLHALAATGASDWLDVRRRERARSRRRLPSRRTLVVIAAALGLLAAATVASGLGSRVIDLLTVSGSKEQVPRPARVAYILADQLHIPGQGSVGLRESLRALLLGRSVPLAVRSPDKRFVMYHAWRDETPRLRLVDLRTKRDILFYRGAQSVAWGRRGLAYVRGVRRAYHPQRPWMGRVVVAKSPSGRPVVWTPVASQYTVLAWAGDTLLVDARGCNLECNDEMPESGIYAIDRPGHLRRLSVTSLVAVSPGGRLVIGGYIPRGTDNPSPVVHVDDVRKRRTLASLDLTRVLPRRMAKTFFAGLSGFGDWKHGQIVGVGGTPVTLVRLRYASQRLSLDSVLTVRVRRDRRFYAFLEDPRFIGPGTDRIVGLLTRAPRTSPITCDLRERHCVHGRPLKVRTQWFSVVTNVSRPLR
jgi:hypothetical protein